MHYSLSFPGKVLILGCGAIAKGFLSILLKYTDINVNHIIIVDKLDKRDEVQESIAKGAQFIEIAITKENYQQFLTQQVRAGDIIVDLSTGISTLALLQWCQENHVHFINTCIDQWCAPHLKPLYDQYMKTVDLARTWNIKTTALLTHGANPGLVSHWTKEGLKDIGQMLLNTSSDKQLKNDIEKALTNNNSAQLAYHTGTKIVQIAERDMQRIDKPKKVDEFVNTWSIYAMYNESTMPVEFSWGSHESHLNYAEVIQKRYILFPQSRAMNYLMYSWVPQGPIIGMLIPHEEAFSISDYLSVYNDDQLVYRPTSYYVYLANDATFCSLHEVSMQDYQLQPNYRILSSEIIDGHDQLGVLLLGDKYGGWWMGSDLSIEETRLLINDHNATILQVSSGLFAGFVWMIKNPEKGFCFPEDLPSDEILQYAAPFLGKNISQPVNWYPKKEIDTQNKWNFEQFLVKR